MNSPPRIGYIIFAIVIPLVLLALQYLVYRKFRRLLIEKYPRHRWAKIVLTSCFIVFNLALIVVAIRRPRMVEYPPWFLFGLAYPFFIWYAATFFMGLLFLIGALVKAPFKIGLWLSEKIPFGRNKLGSLREAPGFVKFDASRRQFIQRGITGLAAVSFAGSAYGVIVGKEKCEVNRTEFFIPRLPAEFDGFTFGLISDIHSGVFMTRHEMEEYAARLNAMGTDCIVVPGDFINNLTDEVYPLAEAFSTLRAPFGVYGVTGNHDYYAAEPEVVIREVNASGIRVLRNERVSLEKNGARLSLIGIDDTGNARRAKTMVDTAIGTQESAGAKVLLCHRPYYLPTFAEQGIDLVLSGHTHGGQVSLGKFGRTVITPASMASPYVWGPYRHGSAQMYVSRGIGTVGLPIRLNCPPELTTIVLRSA